MRVGAPDGKSWCRGHGEFLDRSEFGLKYPEREILRGLCFVCAREASRMYYQRNPAPYKTRAKANNARYRARNRQLIHDYLAASRCLDCGISELVVLEFDHRDTSRKSNDVSNLARASGSSAAILSEIEKCDVVCANCHRRRTARQFGWRRLLGLGQLSLPPLPKRGTADYERIKSKRSRLARTYRNYSHIYQYLREHPCVCCGEDDAVCLDFDHLRDKRREVVLIAAFGGWSDLLAEIEKCRVLCANCHRRHTATAAGRLR